jgi:hypothetical protein
MNISLVWAAGVNRLDRSTCVPHTKRIFLGPDTPYGSAHCVLVGGRLLRADDELLRLWDAPVHTLALRW